jgi:hypothetical protein
MTTTPRAAITPPLDLIGGHCFLLEGGIETGDLGTGWTGGKGDCESERACSGEKRCFHVLNS